MKTNTVRAHPSRSLLRGATSAACLAFIAGLAHPLVACDSRCAFKPKPLFSAVYVIGDSWSDTGRAAAVLNPAPPPATAFLNGRMCNGPVWAEYLSMALGLGYDPLDNFAWAGALTGRKNSFDPTGAIGLPGMLDELDEFVSLLDPDQGADPDALYVVLGGSKDLVKVITGVATAEVVTSELAANTVTIVETLRACGAEYIMVVDIPDWSYGPSFIAREASQPGYLATIRAVCVTANTKLNAALVAADLDVIQVSAFDLVTDAVAHPCKYGLTNVAAVSIPDVELARHYLWWDSIHMTSRMNAWLAVAMLEALRDADVFQHHRHHHVRGGRPYRCVALPHPPAG